MRIVLAVYRIPIGDTGDRMEAILWITLSTLLIVAGLALAYFKSVRWGVGLVLLGIIIAGVMLLGPHFFPGEVVPAVRA